MRQVKRSGRVRRRWPVRVKMAAATAGAIVGTAGSPMPSGTSSLFHLGVSDRQLFGTQMETYLSALGKWAKIQEEKERKEREEKERKDSLFKFLLSGLNAGERIALFSNKMDETALDDFFDRNAIAASRCREEQRISLFKTDEAYFQNGVFDPDRMLHKLSRFYDEAIKLGFPASRVIGEMASRVETIPGISRER